MTYDREEELTELPNGGVRLSVKIKRGENPRNEETTKGELEAESLDELKSDLQDFNSLLEAEARKWRAFQPDEAGEPADD